MNKFYNNILELKNDFDYFFLDAYGVFFDGINLYDGVADRMKEMIDNGKKIIIVSNAIISSSETIEKYHKLGLIKGIHYNDLITSGECFKILLEQKLILEENYSKVFVFGKKTETFANTKYTVVDNLNDADFIYMSTPLLNTEQYNKLSLEDKNRCFKNGKIPTYYNVRPEENSIEIYKDYIIELIKSKKPVVNANQDMFAQVKNQDINGIDFGIRGGAVIKYYNELSKELNIQNIVINIGKPYIDIFNIAKEKLKNYTNNKIENDKIIMIGDTVETDILGAKNAGLHSGLCYETGVTAKILNDNNIQTEKDKMQFLENLKLKDTKFLKRV